MKISILDAVALAQTIMGHVKAAIASGKTDEPIEVDDLGAKFGAVDADIQAARDLEPGP